jgi:hypothetical protein
MTVTWVVDNVLLERHDEGFGMPRIEEAARQLGHDVHVTKYIPFSERPEFHFKYEKMIDKPTILYGSVQWLNQIVKFRKEGNHIGIPGPYFNKEALKYSNYSWRYPGMMLNDDYVLLPYGEIKQRMKLEEFPMFIRCDGVTKTVPGHLVYTFDDVNLLSSYDKTYDEELLVWASPKEIIGEYRHIIVNGEIAGQSQYRRDGKLDIRIDVEPSCQALAKEVARGEYQVDNVYTLDTALTQDGPKIVEFNAFSCSGLYACDTLNIVKLVSEAAEKEFNGEF